MSPELRKRRGGGGNGIPAKEAASGGPVAAAAATVLKDAPTPHDVDWSQFPPQALSRFGHDGSLATTLTGAFAILFTWAVWIGGGASPFWMAWLYLSGHTTAFWWLLPVLLYPLFLPTPAWPAFVRFILAQGGWWRGGALMYVEDSFKGRNVNGPVMLCIHPHGIMPHSFLLNGAGRIHAQCPKRYLPPLYQNMSLKSTGVAEPLLFCIPLISCFLAFFGCAEPASKETLNAILDRQVPFGILVGGSEELLHMEYGKENIYIKKRKGFIKYALQHGYTLALGYSFGESDNYHTLTWAREWRLRLLKKTKILAFLAWGQWWCPFLPVRDHPLNTVVGNPIDLPRIEQPTQADIDKWHAVYIEKLTDLFERNKGAFGYADRKLNLF